MRPVLKTLVVYFRSGAVMMETGVEAIKVNAGWVEWWCGTGFVRQHRADSILSFVVRSDRT